MHPNKRQSHHIQSNPIHSYLSDTISSTIESWMHLFSPFLHHRSNSAWISTEMQLFSAILSTRFSQRKSGCKYDLEWQAVLPAAIALIHAAANNPKNPDFPLHIPSSMQSVFLFHRQPTVLAEPVSVPVLPRTEYILPVPAMHIKPLPHAYKILPNHKGNHRKYQKFHRFLPVLQTRYRFGCPLLLLHNILLRCDPV